MKHICTMAEHPTYQPTPYSVIYETVCFTLATTGTLFLFHLFTFIFFPISKKGEL